MDKLIMSQKYNVSELKCTGWTDSSSTFRVIHPEGYNYENYFSKGVYLGPDKYGIEPLFELKKLEDFNKEELLEAFDLLFEEGEADPESLYSEREQIIEGPDGDECWRLCQKYRQPLIDYCYRNLKTGP